MGVQELLVILLFAAAAFYIGKVIYKNLQAKNACSSGCGKCGADFTKVKVKS